MTTDDLSIDERYCYGCAQIHRIDFEMLEAIVDTLREAEAENYTGMNVVVEALNICTLGRPTPDFAQRREAHRAKRTAQVIDCGHGSTVDSSERRDYNRVGDSLLFPLLIGFVFWFVLIEIVWGVPF